MHFVKLGNSDDAAQHAENRQQTQRPKYYWSGFFGVAGGFGFFGSKEYDENQAEHVKRREARDDQAHGEQPVALLRRQRNDGVLAEESAEGPNAGQRERAHKKRPIRNRHFFAQSPHLPDVLLVVHRKDDGAGAQEQQRLEERVRAEMEHGLRRPAQPYTHDHVAKLGERRISENAFDVVLLDGDERG